MIKILSFLLFTSLTSMVSGNTNLPGQQQDCNQIQDPGDRQYCQYQQMRPQQQQSQQMSDTVRRCNALLGRSEPQAQTPSGPTRNRSTTTTTDAEGRATTTTTETTQETINPATPSTPAGMRPATGLARIWEDLAQPPVQNPAQATTPTFVIFPNDALEAQRCRALQLTAAGTGANSFGVTARQPSMDGRIYCQQLAGYTADYQSCMRALNMYNNVKMAEAALFVVQSVQAQNNQRQVENSTAQRVAEGDGQNAAYDAQISATQKASQLNQQKAAAYAAAVVALGSTLSSWIKESSLPQTLCSGNSGRLGNEQLRPPTAQNLSTDGFRKPAAVGAPECRTAVQIALDSAGGEVIANKQAKAGFTTALMELVAKGIQAGLAAKQLGDVAKKVEEAKKQTENPYDAPTFERCQVDPSAPGCAGPVTRTSGSGLQEGGFGFGDSFGNNAFNPLGEEEKLGDIAPLPLPGDDTVADVSNPFADDAKAANDILDPAGAASVQPGAAGGGGGGGGASAPGGGSASLGNDTPGVDDSKKENDIKANKADGKYNIAGGGAFQAIKGMKEENPFANLFDGKGGGKLEEDRSIASGDIDGQDSGLFSKISKRYGQVQADKRIEAKNLDE